MTPHSGIVLFAHGSRDPLWPAPIEAVAARLAGQRPDLAVACAYLELTQPALPALVDEWSTKGVKAVRIVPMFLGTGRHAREDLPRMVDELRKRHPHLTIDTQVPIGEDLRLTQLMADIAAESFS